MPDDREGCWLIHDQQVLASVERARTRTERRVGLRGRDHLDGVLVLDARSVHTFGVRFPIDVAFCDARGQVVRIVTLLPNRVTRLHPAARTAVEAPAGSFESWGITPGDVLEIV
jgi:uncharacterized protein